MNVYDDYISYLGENMDIISALKDSESPVLTIINDVIRVNDYIYQQYSKKNTIDEDTEEIFSLGYGYLSNVISDLKTYYVEVFEQDINLLNKYSSVLISLIILDDFKSYLDVIERLDDETKKEIDELMYKLDSMIENRRQINQELLEDVEILLSEKESQELDFRPVYIVYAMIAEELELNKDI